MPSLSPPAPIRLPQPFPSLSSPKLLPAFPTQGPEVFLEDLLCSLRTYRVRDVGLGSLSHLCVDALRFPDFPERQPANTSLPSGRRSLSLGESADPPCRLWLWALLGGLGVHVPDECRTRPSLFVNPRRGCWEEAWLNSL